MVEPLNVSQAPASVRIGDGLAHIGDVALPVSASARGLELGNGTLLHPVSFGLRSHLVAWSGELLPEALLAEMLIGEPAGLPALVLQALALHLAGANSGAPGFTATTALIGRLLGWSLADINAGEALEIDRLAASLTPAEGQTDEDGWTRILFATPGGSTKAKEPLQAICARLAADLRRRSDATITRAESALLSTSSPAIRASASSVGGPGKLAAVPRRPDSPSDRSGNPLSPHLTGREAAPLTESGTQASVVDNLTRGFSEDGSAVEFPAVPEIDNESLPPFETGGSLPASLPMGVAALSNKASQQSAVPEVAARTPPAGRPDTSCWVVPEVDHQPAFGLQAGPNIPASLHWGTDVLQSPEQTAVAPSLSPLQGSAQPQGENIALFTAPLGTPPRTIPRLGENAPVLLPDATVPMREDQHWPTVETSPTPPPQAFPSTTQISPFASAPLPQAVADPLDLDAIADALHAIADLRGVAR